ncbi:hypothetical protein KIH74_22560 [Kineosporia sp. J2-2]|uniref:Uncharacterized protein n=1 Tax=Kineosporia corallincola TaxID=2835133 RepID=A0ABS5TKW0_9ACTN|nr:hypothetical protein [Kineosporia corallincola]MBT0771740.1 hypothetical protein [Kineosporia corallincola]
MPGDVEIPAELLAEVEAAKHRFQPKVENGDEIIVLGANSFLGRVIHASTHGGALLAPDAERKMFAGVAWTYALVGRASGPSSPRPQVGDRVLAIEAMLGSEHVVGHVGIAKSVPKPSVCGEFHDWRDEEDRRLSDPSPGAILVEFDPGVELSGTRGVTTACRVEAWALLPALDAKPAADATGSAPADASWSEVHEFRPGIDAVCVHGADIFASGDVWRCGKPEQDAIHLVPTVIAGYVCTPIDACNCAGGDPEIGFGAHEAHCGWEPFVRVSQVPAEIDRLTAERDAARDVAASLEAEGEALRRWLVEQVADLAQRARYGDVSLLDRMRALEGVLDWLDEYPHERGDGESGE